MSIMGAKGPESQETNTEGKLGSHSYLPNNSHKSSKKNSKTCGGGCSKYLERGSTTTLDSLYMYMSNNTSKEAILKNLAAIKHSLHEVKIIQALVSHLHQDNRITVNNKLITTIGSSQLQSKKGPHVLASKIENFRIFFGTGKFSKNKKKS